MAKGKKTGGRNFKKGKSPNPSGRPPVSEEIKQIRTMNSKEMAVIGSRLLNLPRGQLKPIAEGKAGTVLEVIVARILFKAMQSGDEKRLEAVLNRVIGKAPDKIEFTGAGGGPIQALVDETSELTNDELEQRIERLQSTINKFKE